VDKQQTNETGSLKSFIRNLRVDLVGITDLKLLKGMPMGMPSDFASLLVNYKYAIVMGAQLGKLGDKAPGKEVSKFLEKAAMDVASFFEEKRYYALPIHTEDEFDPVNRMGLLSLKVLAKAAGLGWQGRSLLIVSPKYGPVHRLIAVLTNMDLQPDKPIANLCGNCSICIDKCPTQALTFTEFKDHPKHREDVLNVQDCLGDDGCMVCLKACPWAK